MLRGDDDAVRGAAAQGQHDGLRARWRAGSEFELPYRARDGRVHPRLAGHPDRAAACRPSVVEIGGVGQGCIQSLRGLGR